jgi:hypothetical protein
MKSLYRRKIFISNFNVVFINKIQQMCVLPASHLKVHSTLRRDLPMSKVFLRISFALGGAYFALGGVCFLQLHALADENSIA